MTSDGLMREHLEDWLSPAGVVYLRGDAQPELAAMRIRCAHGAGSLIVDAYDVETVEAWFFGTNRALGGEAPARALRTAPDEATGRAVIAAAKAFAGRLMSPS